ncbi:response regulator transcription factor [uncultured Bacteroides sp.]|uniref:response regulator transcription factor n=1 Tax=uncultured Bacteroides sp. TaxID=162156 RepID=UPI0026244E35|nr:response regulator transcription factor [uncultured Bacteroides sp.]
MTKKTNFPPSLPGRDRERGLTVLLVEDEQTLAMIIKDTLEGQDFIIHTAANGEEGLRTFFDLRPDVLVADVMMPRMDGFEMVRRIRQTDKRTPVLFLTARSAISDVVEGFELGANDYLKKPFGMQELIIRIKALVGKAFAFTEEKDKAPTLFDIGDYRFNPVTQRLAFTSAPTSPHANREVELSHRESEILKRLCENRNRVVHTQNLLLDLWGDDSFFNTRSLHVFITKLRHKLAGDERIRIVNVRGIGYKLIIAVV